MTLLPPSRSLNPETYTQVNLGNITWARKLQSGNCHFPTSATKCNMALLACFNNGVITVGRTKEQKKWRTKVCTVFLQTL